MSNLPPLALTDTGSWITELTRKGETSYWRGRCINFASLVGRDGITSIESRRLKVWEWAELNARGPSALFSVSNKPKQTYTMAACPFHSTQAQSSSKPARRYTLRFDGSTKVATVVADTLSDPNPSRPGEFTFTLKSKLVGTYRYVSSIEAEDIPPTEAEIRANLESQIAYLKDRLQRCESALASFRHLQGITAKAYEGSVDDLGEVIGALTAIRDIAQASPAKPATLKRVVEIANEALSES